MENVTGGKLGMGSSVLFPVLFLLIFLCELHGLLAV